MAMSGRARVVMFKAGQNSRENGVPLAAKPGICREGREVGDPDATEGRDGKQTGCWVRCKGIPDESRHGTIDLLVPEEASRFRPRGPRGRCVLPRERAGQADRGVG